MTARYKFLVLALVLSLSKVLIGQAELPLNLPDFLIPSLHESVDIGLENRLTLALKANPEWAELIRQKRLAVGLVDLKDISHVRFARVNGDEMMYAASLPKIAVLLAAMDALERGELKDCKEVRQDMNAMICYSNNQASTRMIDRLGYQKIETVLTDPRYELYDKASGGGLWVGKRYAAGGARYPDPLKGLSHGATAAQVCRFYYFLAMGKLVSWERSKQMLEIMDEPALHHKFVNTLDQVAPKAEVYRKSGSWKTYHSDSVLVWGNDPRRRYILVALTEHPEGERIIREMINVAEKVLDLRP